MLLSGKLFTHMCFCHQAVSFGTGHLAVMPFGWEGNHSSGFALAIHHKLKWLYIMSSREMSTHLHGAWHSFLYIVHIAQLYCKHFMINISC